MKFNVVSPEESKTCGKLRFSAPIQEEIEKASKEIWQLCCDRLGKLYGVTELGSEWLAPELSISPNLSQYLRKMMKFLMFLLLYCRKY